MAKSKSKIKLPIILMAWPLAGMIISFFLYIVINFVLATSGMFNGSGMIANVTNVTLFVVTLGSIVLGIPSFTVGLILLILRLANKPSSNFGLGIAGMVLGIVSIMATFFVVGVIIGVVGICLSTAAIKRSNSQKGMAITGLVTSIVGVVMGAVFSLILLLAALSGVSDAAKSAEVKSQALIVSSIVVNHHDNNNSVYPSYKDLMDNLMGDYRTSYIVGSIGVYGSVKDIEYIPCYGDGAQVWYWDFESETYNSITYGDTSNCQY